MSKVPEDLKFTKSHEWFKEEGGIVTMGISDYAQGQLTDIVYIELPSVGSKKKAGDVLLTIESVKSAEDVYSPVEGEVIEVNKALTDKPELVNSDSYNYWMVKLKKTGKESESLNPKDYKKFIGE
ncbi:MAG: glycine cleavage system protein GcvH [Candidatus Thermoplasmatota archaeon]|nr:glycine cleavage system protein GcvH [Candidatus Thermoplasmatota archaeon]